MKNIFFMCMMVLTGFGAMAQFKSGTLQAAGLTCAMCTRAINNSLSKLPFIESVNADIKNSQFIIQFKQGVNADPDMLKKAVEDAGFSIATLKLTIAFNNLKVENDSHVSIQGKNYHFLAIQPQVLKGEKNLTFVDKNFVLAKEFKKFAAKTQMACVQTGKAQGCCSREGIKENSRIYHVTI